MTYYVLGGGVKLYLLIQLAIKRLKYFSAQ